MSEDFGYYERTYSLKLKDDVYAWIYDADGSERFPGVTFQTAEEGLAYHDKLYPPGQSYVKFERKKI